MKQIVLIIALTLCCDSLGQNIPDTINAKIEGSTFIIPMRLKTGGKTKKAGKDSILVGSKFIIEAGLYYYLKVYSEDDILIHEGYYFDQYPAGTMIRYDELGRKRMKGEYELLEPTKKANKYQYELTGTVTSYQYKGKKTEPYQVGTTIYHKDSRKVSYTLRDQNGEVIKEMETTRPRLYR